MRTSQGNRSFVVILVLSIALVTCSCLISLSWVAPPQLLRQIGSLYNANDRRPVAASPLLRNAGNGGQTAMEVGMSSAESPRSDKLKKIGIVTGASTGIGLATVEGMARSGQYSVIILAGRNAEKHERAIKKLRSSTGLSIPAVELKHMPLDLASLESARDFVAAFTGLRIPLHTLVLNAGVMALPTRRLTADGHEYQFGVNHLAHFLLANLLLDTLVASSSAADPGRVIALSSTAHKIASPLQSGDLRNLQQKEYSPWGAYGQSKLANLLFIYELDRRCRELGLPIAANAVHPGVVNTELFESDGAISGPLQTLVRGALSFAASTPEEGARTSVLLATTADGKLSGRYWQDERPAPSLDEDPAGQLPLPAGLRALLPLPKARTSYDPKTWAELWNESERLVGLTATDVAAWR